MRGDLDLLLVVVVMMMMSRPMVRVVEYRPMVVFVFSTVARMLMCRTAVIIVGVAVGMRTRVLVTEKSMQDTKERPVQVVMGWTMTDDGPLWFRMGWAVFHRTVWSLVCWFTDWDWRLDRMARHL